MEAKDVQVRVSIIDREQSIYTPDPRRLYCILPSLKTSKPYDIVLKQSYKFSAEKQFVGH